jgi:two-component system chemotaxis response regulator CheY
MATVILHVDDSPTIRQWITSVLKIKGGVTVLSAEDGVEALNILSTTTVDLLLSDLEMPRVDGLELAKAVRNMPQHKYLPILILSTRTPESFPVKRREAVTGWITKPVDADLLNRWVNRLLPG